MHSNSFNGFQNSNRITLSPQFKRKLRIYISVWMYPQNLVLFVRAKFYQREQLLTVFMVISENGRNMFSPFRPLKDEQLGAGDNLSN